MYTCIVRNIVTDSIFVLSVVVMYTQAMGSKEWREVGTGGLVVDLNHVFVRMQPVKDYYC